MTFDALLDAFKIGDFEVFQRLFAQHVVEEKIARDRRRTVSREAAKSLIEAARRDDPVKFNEILTDAFIDHLEQRIIEAAALHGLADPFEQLAEAAIRLDLDRHRAEAA